MEKLIITGSSGMLGSNLALELREKYDIIGLYRSSSNPVLKNQFKIDLIKEENTSRLISSINPDFVIHCAALTDVDICEGDYALARDTNATATRDLISYLGPETRFVYVSTDSVFDGRQGNYNETDPPSPLNNYAKSKLEGESFVEGGSKNYVIIRTNLFGWNHVKGLSFAEWIYDSLSRKRPIDMFTDVVFSPIFAGTLSSLIDTLLEKDFVGRLNIGSTNSISKYNFGLYLAGLFGFDKSLITPVSVDSFEFKAKRPKDTSLDVSKAKGIFDPLPTVEDELEKFFNTRKRGQ